MSSSSDSGFTPIEGTLWQNVMFGFWSKRFCKLEDNTFSIYKKRSDKHPETIIDMTSHVTIEIMESSSNKFKINIKNEESIYLQAATTNEMMMWILDLRSCAFINAKLSIEDFHLLYVIGRGKYGKVMLCKKKDTQELLAMKTVRKSKLMESGMLKAILAERNILSEVKSPFIVSLKYAFQTASKFYLCLEYAPGGDLFHLLKEGRPPKDDIKLYIAELSIAINELHKNGVIYRDLKPENILFDEKGHVKLTDFGLSQNIDNQELLAICGTSEYMAPEMIKRKGYTKQIDWWALGILSYEMFFGKTPFQAENKKQIFQNILKMKPYFPEDADNDVVNFIKSLLNKDPKKRGNFETIKKSSLMKNINFDAVMNYQIPPLHVPVIEDITKPNNFDSEFTNEVALDSLATNDNNYPMIAKFSFPCIPDQIEFPELIPLD